MTDVLFLDTQIYILLFLIGAFTVKTLSEMMNWSSRGDMSLLWILFIVVLVVHDAAFQPYGIMELVLKWGLVGVAASCCYMSYFDFMVKDDKLALLVAISILNFLLVVLVMLLFLAMVLFFRKKLEYLYQQAGSEKIPAMPIITSSLIISVMLYVLIYFTL
ncbi:MAG: hypothetical protein R6U61_05115 [Thermoplasmata archaeon]